MASEFGDEFDSADEEDLVALSNVKSPPQPNKRTSDFGIDSDDDADFIALVDENATRPRKRKSDSDDRHPSKRPAVAKAYASALTALTKNFGMKAFRLKQEQAISRILDGGSAVVVFPTGGGKSLCYQVPALCFEVEDELTNAREHGEHGITLVVSPLIALMKDQVDALKKRGIKAAAMDSTKSRDEYLAICDDLRRGDIKLIYCSPEKLNNEGFVEQMKFVRGGIRLLAVDEAHCISQWGHAFRPDYLKVSRFAREIKAERVVCLTATATERVAADIRKAFDIPEDGLFRTSMYRPNLQLLAESAPTKKKLHPRLFKFLKQNPGPTIIYVTLQKQTEDLALDLERQGFKAKSFHAGMATENKTKIQEDFMAQNDLIICATIAFGMGIDKANIRNVIHFSIPNSLESYSQEIGRAGRDGKLSKCMFYVCTEDLHLRELFSRGDLPSKPSIRGLLQEIFHGDASKLPIGSTLQFNHSAQSKAFDIRATTLKNIYAQLELAHGLIRETTPVYTKYSFKAGPNYKSTLSSDRSDAGKAIAKNTKLAKLWTHIDVETAAKSVGIDRAQIVRKLNLWNENKVIELQALGVQATYKITQRLPKTNAELEKLNEALFTTLDQRERDDLSRADEMLDLIHTPSCYSKTLANHFGDDLPDGKNECGHCTWCLTHKAIVKDSPPPVAFNQAAFQAILEKVPARDDPRLLAKIAFGISSPRITSLGAGRGHLFGSMEDHEFMDLLRAFAEACK